MAAWTFIAPTVEHTPRTPRGTSSSPRHDDDFPWAAWSRPARPAFTPAHSRHAARRGFQLRPERRIPPTRAGQTASPRNISPSLASTPATPPPAHADFQFRLEGTGASAFGHAALCRRGGRRGVLFGATERRRPRILSGAALDDAVPTRRPVWRDAGSAGYDLREVRGLPLPPVGATHRGRHGRRNALPAHSRADTGRRFGRLGLSLTSTACNSAASSSPFPLSPPTRRQSPHPRRPASSIWTPTVADPRPADHLQRRHPDRQLLQPDERIQFAGTARRASPGKPRTGPLDGPGSAVSSV